ncbi:MAG TPA: autotransporter domain-containing protein [Devosiaceae bacterium]|jgi:uncharacterized protein with beta-barrel porin domain|nr:autotransporter domain-containing protein [Devosiaceae bacterium]
MIKTVPLVATLLCAAATLPVVKAADVYCVNYSIDGQSCTALADGFVHEGNIAITHLTFLTDGHSGVWNGDQISSGNIIGFVKDGAGRLVFNGQQINDGEDPGSAPHNLVHQGTLAVRGDSLLGTVLLSPGAQLEITDGYFANYIEGNIGIPEWNVPTDGGILIDAGTVVMANRHHLYFGPTLVRNGGHLTIGSRSLLRTSRLDVDGTSTVTLGPGGFAQDLYLATGATLATEFNFDLAGTMQGGTWSKTGTGNITVNGAAPSTMGVNVLSGSVTAHQIHNTPTFAAVSTGAQLRIGGAADGVFGGTISGAGELHYVGSGELNVTSDQSHTGKTFVSGGGTLRLNGALQSEIITVSNGSTLAGAGEVNAVVLDAGSVLAPGNSVGTLVINGSLSIGAGAVLEVELRPGGTTPGIDSDLVAAAGAVVIDPAATVVVKPEGGADTGTTYAANTRYTILTSGGVTGKFASVADHFAFLDASLSYDSGSVFLTMQRNGAALAQFAQSGNQSGAARALAAFSSPHTKNAVLNLSEQPVPEALASASGDANASNQAAIDRGLGLFGGALQPSSGGTSGSVLSLLDVDQGIGGPPGSSLHVEAPASNAAWLNPLLGRGTIASDGNGSATSWTAAGLAVGVERSTGIMSGDATVGLGAGYIVSRVQTPARIAESEALAGQFGVYGEWTDGVLTVAGSAFAGAAHVSSSRGITIGGLRRTATAKYWMQNFGVSLEASYAVEVTDEFLIGPVAGIDLAFERTQRLFRNRSRRP